MRASIYSVNKAYSARSSLMVFDDIVPWTLQLVHLPRFAPHHTNPVRLSYCWRYNNIYGYLSGWLSFESCQYALQRSSALWTNPADCHIQPKPYNIHRRSHYSKTNTRPTGESCSLPHIFWRYPSVYENGALFQFYDSFPQALIVRQIFLLGHCSNALFEMNSSDTTTFL